MKTPLRAIVLGVLAWLPKPTEAAPQVVVEMPARGAAERAGVRVGDVLHTWSRGGSAPAPFGNPFELARVEIEELPLGPIEIAGERDGQPTSWTLKPGVRGVATRPRFEADAEALFEQGQTSANGGDLAAARDAWQRVAAASSEPVSKAWLRVWEARSAATAHQRDLASAAFEDAARQLEPVDACAAAQVLREWGSTVLVPRRELDRADDVFERARRLDARRGETLSSAFDVHWLSYAQRVRGKLDVATQLEREALEIRERLAPDGLEVAASLNDLGTIVLDADDYKTAEGYFRRALEIRQRLDPDGTHVAGSLNNLGITAIGQGDLRQAEHYFVEALRLKRELHVPPEVLASSIGNLGNLAHLRGELAAADDYFSQALRIQEALGNSADAEGWLTDLGLVAADRMDYEAAVDYQTRALAISERLAPNSLALTTDLQNLGIALRGAGRLDEAREHLERALELNRKLAPDGVIVAGTLNDLAQLHHTTGDLERAEAELGDAQALYERLSPASVALATNMNQAGELALVRSDLDGAQESFSHALRIRRQWAPGSRGEADALYGLARVERARAHPAQATGLFCQAADVLDRQRARLGSSDEGRLGFGLTFAQYYRECMDGLLAQEHSAEAFHVLERSRARSLLTLLAERDLVLEGDAPVALAQEARALDAEYDRLVESLSQLDKAQLVEQAPALETRQREVRDRRTALAAELRRTSPRMASLTYPQPLTYDGARKLLDPGTVMLSYDVGPERVRLFVLSTDGAQPAPHVFTLPIAEKDLREKVTQYLRVLRRPDGDGAGALARELYTLLVAPAEADARAGRRLLIAPDGPLHLLPFGSLIRSAVGTRPSYLVEWRPVHVVASATLYAELVRSRPSEGIRPQTLVAFGDPSTGSWKDGDAMRSVDASLRFALRDGLPALPAARDEVREIGRLFPHTTTYLGDQATEEHAKQLDAGARYVHFACHALLDERQPLNSALVLSHPAGAGSENGLLQAWEIFESVRLHADLVTLSACDTGLGQDIGGEGLASLTRAFTYAGARSVLASQWRVSDISTEMLMRRFYTELRAGRAKDEALQRAQVALIHDRRYTLPFHWAAFQLSGDWK